MNAMTLNLSDQEAAAVEALAKEDEMSKTAVLRQALRMYQLIRTRIRAGETMSFSGDNARMAFFVGVGLTPSLESLHQAHDVDFGDGQPLVPR